MTILTTHSRTAKYGRRKSRMREFKAHFTFYVLNTILIGLQFRTIPRRRNASRNDRLIDNNLQWMHKHKRI